MIRSGIGFDAHQLKKGFDLYIGGIKIDSNLGSLGHSDGDALIHALADSLLGAAGMGDIGQYFPSEEKEWKNAKSEIFLIEVKKILISNGFKISNIDCTVILQKPKINSYIELIRNNISRILELNKNYVSIKATTTDYLGYIGDSKGWSVISIATIIDENEHS
jgi:2-C-methyl-D-erythritol 2,4-cyclodiphosphate synthase